MKKRLILYGLGMPVIHCLLLTLGYLCVYFILVDYVGADWGSLVYLIILNIFYALAVSPLMAFFYCKKIHTMGLGWTKYLCCVYNSVIMDMYFLIVSTLFSSIPIDFEYVRQAMLGVEGLSVLIPSLICGVVTLTIYNVKSVR